MKQIGRYQIIRKLGKGGMGSVFKGIVPIIDKVVAIKLLDPFETMLDILGIDKLKEIFLYEAQTMASLRHPSIVQVWDYDDDDQGRPFIVMEYLCNNLGDMIGENFLVEESSRIIQPEKVIDYGHQILAGLSYLHHNGIVHRDIKPFNILVADDDAIKICDFGMALVEGVSFSGPSMMQIGSPYYTPPEQSRDPQQVDGRADLFATGVLLYRMLTGKLPGMQSFSLSMVNPLYDQEWDDFFSKSMNWNPDERYESAIAMQLALTNLHLNWQAQQKPPNQEPIADQQPITLRSEPVNICGSKAATLFAVNTLFRPHLEITNTLHQEQETIHDHTTSLMWQQGGSEYPVSWQEGLNYVEKLNRASFAGSRTWRLPTVNELLSLFAALTTQSATSGFDPFKNRMWSCDSHGHHERWYVNFAMGYAGNQDMNCFNYVRAVCSI
ncbi:MAG: protein kinase [Spirochaetales bacterium]|nr:protein kinase [Spirochaetales bacterium]